MIAQQVDLSAALEDVQRLLQQRHALRTSLASSAAQLTNIASTAKHRHMTKRQVTDLYDCNRKRKVDNEALSAECEQLRRELHAWTERHEALQHQTSCADMYLQDVHAEIAIMKKKHRQLQQQQEGSSPKEEERTNKRVWTEACNTQLTEQLLEFAKLRQLVENSQEAIATKRALARDMMDTLKEGEDSLRQKSALLEQLEDELEQRQELRRRSGAPAAAADGTTVVGSE